MDRQLVTSDSINLSSNHMRELLDESGIARAVINERGYHEAKDSGELMDLGFAPSQRRVPGLLIPLHSVDGIQFGSIYKPDNPRVIKGKTLKYENPKGSHLRVDCPPRCQPQLGDPTVPLFVTEGVKKGDALASRGCCTVDLLGVWGFKGKNESGGTTVLDDWHHIALRGRPVYIAYDSDVTVKPQVRQALDTLV